MSDASDGKLCSEKGKSVAAIKKVLTGALRFIVLWAVDAVSLLITSAIVPGIYFQSAGATGSNLVLAAAAAFMLGIVNLLIRPLILLLTLPLGLIVMVVVGIFANAIALKITSSLLPQFVVTDWWAAFLGGLILSAANTVITNVLTIDDDNSFYQGVVERLAKRKTFEGASEPGRGLVMMEIDGLSYWHIQKALEKGMLPTLSEMMREQGYALSRVDCGVPSQTSACQAGIMFGDNYDIPAFRWYDKDRGKLMVSSKDAPEINARYAKGQGLMRGGSSINNMLNGDAEKSMLTLTDLRSGTPEQKKERARDLYLLMVNPYFLMRTVVLLFGDAIREIYEGQKQRVQKVYPRMNRLHHFYPLLRAATTVFMRDVTAYLMTLDIIRGAPSIYVTLPGYDEVAHHSGPWTSDAFGVLKRYDPVIAHIRDVIARKAPRPYDLIVLSDHGQSFGATFKQRYGYDLKEFIEQHLPEGMHVTQTSGGDDGTISMAAVSGELDNIKEQGVGGRVGGAVVSSGQKALQAEAQGRSSNQAVEPAHVTVCGSGNLAPVYFGLYPRRILRRELEEAYPGMFEALVQHEGVGFVVAYEDETTAVAYGKEGSRNLHTGAVNGGDPLEPYGDTNLRAEQMRRLADFPHSGDLTVMSTVYPDGTVAALEELIGSHGGMGGEQTDAFIFHPADMPVAETKNSTDVFHILNARRGTPVTEPQRPAQAPVDEVSAWDPANLVRGLQHPSVWLGRALRCLVLDSSAYGEVAKDVYMTAPALVIAGLALLLESIVSPGPWTVLGYWTLISAWLISALVAFGAARALGGRAGFTTTLRAIGFASVTWAIELFVLVPPMANLARLMTLVVGFFAVWIGVSAAQELRGWRSVVLPVAYVVLFNLIVLALGILLAGATLSLASLTQELGLAPRW